MRERLPTQFDKETNEIIEEIDVLWLSGQMIMAAFEVEHSTSIFSGLLRMSDLVRDHFKTAFGMISAGRRLARLQLA
jgi:hypothetical protein